MSVKNLEFNWFVEPHTPLFLLEPSVEFMCNLFLLRKNRLRVNIVFFI
jgi:hypothetical protein